MKKYAYIVVAATYLLAGGCTDNTDDPKNPKPVICPIELGELQRPTYDFADARTLQEVAPDNVGRANGFATNLFRTVYKAKPGNICVSPASVFCTFAMMANGDDGDCRDEILNMLGYSNDADALHDLNVYANALLRETSLFDGATQCGFTNSIWHRPGVNIFQDFATDIEAIFGGMIFPTWLGDKQGMEAINKFIYDQTCGMIYPFLENPLEADLAFLNTTYFKGAWETAFVKELTKDNDFHNIDGSKSKVPFMKTFENLFDYTETEGIRCLSLPYKGNRYSLTIFQPLNGTKKEFTKMMEAFDGETLERYEKYMQRQSFSLMMPKFETAINEDILASLKKIGIDKTCSQGLNKVTDMPLPLVLFQHAVRIIIDEEGTEGGAASLGGVFTTSGPAYRPTEVKIDSPFIYMIRDTQAGTVLFMGAVTEF